MRGQVVKRVKLYASSAVSRKIRGSYRYAQITPVGQIKVQLPSLDGNDRIPSLQTGGNFQELLYKIFSYSHLFRCQFSEDVQKGERSIPKWEKLGPNLEIITRFEGPLKFFGWCCPFVVFPALLFKLPIFPGWSSSPSHYNPVLGAGTAYFCPIKPWLCRKAVHVIGECIKGPHFGQDSQVARSTLHYHPKPSNSVHWLLNDQLIQMFWYSRDYSNRLVLLSSLEKL